MYAVDVVPNLPTPLMQTTVSLTPINVVSYYYCMPLCKKDIPIIIV